MKINRVLFYYSLVVTFLLLMIFIVFISTVSVPESRLPKYLFIMNEKGVTSFIQNGPLQLPGDRMNSSVVTGSSLENYYIGELLKRVPLLIVCLVAMLIAGTVLLSKILQRQQEKQSLLLAKQLSGIGESHAMPDQHPAIAKAYQGIKERMEASALDYVRLSAYVTHEQKNILSLLRAKLQLSANTALTEEVDKIADSLDDILTLSASKDKERVEIVDAALVCANVCDEYRKVHPDIRFDFDEDVSSTIRARELWIGRAVSNLVSNAVKYGGDGQIQVAVTGKKGSVVITVSDEGEGIDEAEQEKLFDYQYRVGKLKRDGYGIGLSLVRHVCELCEGLCWVENRKGKGATFYMVFPEALTLD